jgi:uroporphyrin-III C-methyltransferase / precorrin-2 dehydrogenase / sirohydrochlorin ferrochelatase
MMLGAQAAKGTALRYFPIFFDLDGRDVVIVGGGEKALQKLRLLAKTSARLKIVAAEVSQDITAADVPTLVLERHAFTEADLDGASLVFAASDDPELDARVAAAARSRGLPINVVDGPSQSNFIMPAIVDRDPVLVAIGTEGAAPILAREIKAKIESWLPAQFGRVAQRAQQLRRHVHDAIADPVVRRRTWEALLQGVWRSAVLAGDSETADRELDRQLAAGGAHAQPVGSVALIGCGPGEPDLITLKAQQRLQSADVLVVDRLVNPAILEYARRDAVRIDVGKEPEGDSALQEDINRILVREALKGQRVVRLKGGDAFVFGRAAEEMAAVRAAGIPVEVVPGITAAHACAASVGLPVTLRAKVRQFAVVTGASADGPLELDWPALAQPGQAFAIYMGVRTAQHFRDKLLGAGAAPQTPVVIVENGTLSNERALATELALVADAIAEAGIHGPAVIFVGLDWASGGLSRPDKVEVYEAQRRRAGGAVIEAGEPAATPQPG